MRVMQEDAAALWWRIDRQDERPGRAVERSRCRHASFLGRAKRAACSSLMRFHTSCGFDLRPSLSATSRSSHPQHPQPRHFGLKAKGMAAPARQYTVHEPILFKSQRAALTALLAAAGADRPGGGAAASDPPLPPGEHRAQRTSRGSRHRGGPPGGRAAAAAPALSIARGRDPARVAGPDSLPVAPFRRPAGRHVREPWRCCPSCQ